MGPLRAVLALCEGAVAGASVALVVLLGARLTPGCFDPATLLAQACTGQAPLVTPTAVPSNLPSAVWVSTSGSDSNAGTYASPFLTIQHAANVSTTAGDTIVVMPGEYQATSGELVIVPYGGSSGSPLTYICQTYHGCTLDGDSQSATSAFDFDDARSYVTIQYFVIQNFAGAAINANGGSDGCADANTYVSVIDNLITGNGDGMRGGTCSEHDLIEGNEIANSGTTGTCPGGADDHGLYLSGGNYSIFSNVFHDNDCGWDIQYATETGDTPTGSVVANNTFGWHANVGGSSNPGYVILYANGIETPSVTFTNDYFLQNTGTYGSPVHCYPTTVVGSPTIGITYTMEGNSAAISDCSSYTSSSITQNVNALFADAVSGASALGYLFSTASPLRGAGTEVSGATTDFYGYARPTPPSIGAMEFPY